MENESTLKKNLEENNDGKFPEKEKEEKFSDEWDTDVDSTIPQINPFSNIENFSDTTSHNNNNNNGPKTKNENFDYHDFRGLDDDYYSPVQTNQDIHTENNQSALKQFSFEFDPNSCLLSQFLIKNVEGQTQAAIANDSPLKNRVDTLVGMTFETQRLHQLFSQALTEQNVTKRWKNYLKKIRDMGEHEVTRDINSQLFQLLFAQDSIDVSKPGVLKQLSEKLRQEKLHPLLIQFMLTKFTQQIPNAMYGFIHKLFDGLNTVHKSVECYSVDLMPASKKIVFDIVFVIQPQGIKKDLVTVGSRIAISVDDALDHDDNIYACAEDQDPFKYLNVCIESCKLTFLEQDFRQRFLANKQQSIFQKIKDGVELDIIDEYIISHATEQCSDILVFQGMLNSSNQKDESTIIDELFKAEISVQQFNEIINIQKFNDYLLEQVKNNNTTIIEILLSDPAIGKTFAQRNDIGQLILSLDLELGDEFANALSSVIKNKQEITAENFFQYIENYGVMNQSDNDSFLTKLLSLNQLKYESIECVENDEVKQKTIDAETLWLGCLGLHFDLAEVSCFLPEVSQTIINSDNGIEKFKILSNKLYCKDNQFERFISDVARIEKWIDEKNIHQLQLFLNTNSEQNLFIEGLKRNESLVILLISSSGKASQLLKTPIKSNKIIRGKDFHTHLTSAQACELAVRDGDAAKILVEARTKPFAKNKFSNEQLQRIQHQWPNITVKNKTLVLPPVMQVNKGKSFELLAENARLRDKENFFNALNDCVFNENSLEELKQHWKQANTILDTSDIVSIIPRLIEEISKNKQDSEHNIAILHLIKSLEDHSEILELLMTEKPVHSQSESLDEDDFLFSETDGVSQNIICQVIIEGLSTIKPDAYCNKNLVPDSKTLLLLYSAVQDKDQRELLLNNEILFNTLLSNTQDDIFTLMLKCETFAKHYLKNSSLSVDSVEKLQVRLFQQDEVLSHQKKSLLYSLDDVLNKKSTELLRLSFNCFQLLASTGSQSSLFANGPRRIFEFKTLAFNYLLMANQYSNQFVEYAINNFTAQELIQIILANNNFPNVAVVNTVFSKILLDDNVNVQFSELLMRQESFHRLLVQELNQKNSQLFIELLKHEKFAILFLNKVDSKDLTDVLSATCQQSLINLLDGCYANNHNNPIKTSVIVKLLHCCKINDLLDDRQNLALSIDKLRCNFKQQIEDYEKESYQLINNQEDQIDLEKLSPNNKALKIVQSLNNDPETIKKLKKTRKGHEVFENVAKEAYPHWLVTILKHQDSFYFERVFSLVLLDANNDYRYAKEKIFNHALLRKTFVDKCTPEQLRLIFETCQSGDIIQAILNTDGGLVKLIYQDNKPSVRHALSVYCKLQSVLGASDKSKDTIPSFIFKLIKNIDDENVLKILFNELHQEDLLYELFQIKSLENYIISNPNIFIKIVHRLTGYQLNEILSNKDVQRNLIDYLIYDEKAFKHIMVVCDHDISTGLIRCIPDDNCKIVSIEKSLNGLRSTKPVIKTLNYNEETNQPVDIDINQLKITANTITSKQHGFQSDFINQIKSLTLNQVNQLFTSFDDSDAEKAFVICLVYFMMSAEFNRDQSSANKLFSDIKFMQKVIFLLPFSNEVIKNIIKQDTVFLSNLARCYALPNLEYSKKISEIIFKEDNADLLEAIIERADKFALSLLLQSARSDRHYLLLCHYKSLARKFVNHSSDSLGKALMQNVIEDQNQRVEGNLQLFSNQGHRLHNLSELILLAEAENKFNNLVQWDEGAVFALLKHVNFDQLADMNNSLRFVDCLISIFLMSDNKSKQLIKKGIVHESLLDKLITNTENGFALLTFILNYASKPMLMRFIFNSKQILNVRYHGMFNRCCQSVSDKSLNHEFLSSFTNGKPKHDKVISNILRSDAVLFFDYYSQQKVIDINFFVTSLKGHLSCLDNVRLDKIITLFDNQLADKKIKQVIEPLAQSCLTNLKDSSLRSLVDVIVTENRPSLLSKWLQMIKSPENLQQHCLLNIDNANHLAFLYLNIKGNQPLKSLLFDKLKNKVEQGEVDLRYLVVALNDNTGLNPLVELFFKLPSNVLLKLFTDSNLSSLDNITTLLMARGTEHKEIQSTLEEYYQIFCTALYNMYISLDSHDSIKKSAIQSYNNLAMAIIAYANYSKPLINFDSKVIQIDHYLRKFNRWADKTSHNTHPRQDQFSVSRRLSMFIDHADGEQLFITLASHLALTKNNAQLEKLFMFLPTVRKIAESGTAINKLMLYACFTCLDKNMYSTGYLIKHYSSQLDAKHIKLYHQEAEKIKQLLLEVNKDANQLINDDLTHHEIVSLYNLAIHSSDVRAIVFSNPKFVEKLIAAMLDETCDIITPINLNDSTLAQTLIAHKNVAENIITNMHIIGHPYHELYIEGTNLVINKQAADNILNLLLTTTDRSAEIFLNNNPHFFCSPLTLGQLHSKSKLHAEALLKNSISSVDETFEKSISKLVFVLAMSENFANSMQRFLKTDSNHNILLAVWRKLLPNILLNNEDHRLHNNNDNDSSYIREVIQSYLYQPERILERVKSYLSTGWNELENCIPQFLLNVNKVRENISQDDINDVLLLILAKFEINDLIRNICKIDTNDKQSLIQFLDIFNVQKELTPIMAHTIWQSIFYADKVDRKQLLDSLDPTLRKQLVVYLNVVRILRSDNEMHDKSLDEKALKNLVKNLNTEARNVIVQTKDLQWLKDFNFNIKASNELPDSNEISRLTDINELIKVK